MSSDGSQSPAAREAPRAPERTVLSDVHRASGAVLVDFHGWEMPVRYGAIPDEHRRVREAAGLFDLCHMGRLELRGEGAERWLDRVLTIDVPAMAEGRARYGLVLNERGTPIDDTILYRLAGRWLLVVNASNRERVVAWMEEHRPAAARGARLADLTREQAMVAIQGPRSAGIVAALIDEPAKPWDSLRYYQITTGRFRGARGGVEVLIARTGYTGEDGFELYLPAGDAEALWARALEVGGDAIGPIGLGARDTLRLEAGMPLYGHEIDETTDPFEAGLGFAVKLDKPGDFIGKDRLLEVRERGTRRNLRGFRVEGRRVARQGMALLAGDRPAGVVTSGAPSPTLGFPIAMGYLARRAEEESRDDLAVDVRGNREKVSIVPLPFFSRTRK